MKTPLKALPLLLLIAACATTSKVSAGPVVKQADHKEPEPKTGRDAGEIAQISALEDVYGHMKRAQMARLGGDEDTARAEDKISADLLAQFVTRFPSDEYQLVFLRMAAERYLAVRDWEAAANTAQRIVDSKYANEVSRAIGARLAAGAWQQLAVQEMRSGKIPPLQLRSYEQRRGADPTPQVPPLSWKMYVESADLYVKLQAADPVAKATAEERRLSGGVDVPQLQLIAAQVEFGYDNMEDARRRFLALIEQVPSKAEIMETSVPYYLETFRVMKDDAGYDQALARLQPVFAGEARKAAAAAAAAGATEAQRKNAAALAKLDDDLTRRLKGSGYTAAGESLRKGEAAEKAGKGADALAHYREAATRFEQFAADQADSPDAPNALFNAAIAWDKAKEPKKAIADREKLVAKYPDAKIVPQALVVLGVGHAREGNSAKAAQAYETYLSRWPNGPQHCVALQNLGVALQQTGRKVEAAQRYQQFAGDEGCLKDDPNNAAKVLYEAGKLFTEAKKPGEARKAFQALVDLPGVTDVVPRSYQADAKERLKKMK
jgi:tetratricopeptide (TPR) repeat protein